jgi:hypothetical protein
MQNVRKVVSEADGYQPHLIAPENGYRRLIESSLLLFRGPAEAVVDAVWLLFEFLDLDSPLASTLLYAFPLVSGVQGACPFGSTSGVNHIPNKSAFSFVPQT